MRPGPSAAASLIATAIAIDSPPRQAVEVLAEIALSQTWCTTASDASERAEVWLTGFLARLRREASELAALGRPCPYDFNSSSDDMLQGPAFVEPSDSPEVKAAKQLRAGMSDYVAALAAIDPTEFECMCKGILFELGVRDAGLTPSTSDEGIDFYGRLRLADIAMTPVTLPSVYEQLNAWLVGQAKHYPAGQAATPEVRELVGSVSLAQAGAFSRVESAYPSLRLRLCDPVFYLFFTTGTISAPGWRLLEASGAVGMDGAMVAAFLADRQIGRVGGAFDFAALRLWIAEHC